MSNELLGAKNKEKKQRGTGFIVIIAVVLILFLVSTVLLGSQLYEVATRDRHTVNMTVGEAGEIELFDIRYSNESGEITVQGVNADNVVAPGTSVDYDIRLRNNEDYVIDFVMLPHVQFLTEDDIPIRFKLKDDHGNYLLGDENTWAYSDSVNAVEHRGQIHPGEVFTYHLTWQWVFENGEDQDAYDTYLANLDGAVVPGVTMGISTEATANMSVSKDVTHVTHLKGESMGCCWCCWLVWILLLVAVLLLIWVWQLKKKLNKLEDVADQYEETLRLGNQNL